MPALAREGSGRTCPECLSTRVSEDPESGDIVCANCGFVIAERTLQPGPEWRYLGEEEVSREHIGPPASLRKADFGLATTIGDRHHAGKLGMWEMRTFYTRQQRSLRRGLKLIETFARRLNIGTTATDRAAYTYRKAIRKRLLRGRSIKSMAAASIYSSCREADIPRTLDAVAEAAGIERKVLARDYRNLIESLEIRMPIAEPERYVARIADSLSIDEKTKRKAYSSLRQAKRNGLVTGLDPKGLASGALYLASQDLAKHPSQEAFAKSAGVSAFTIRKRAHQLKRYLETRKQSIAEAKRLPKNWKFVYFPS